MKQWQEKLPTLNLVLISVILVVILFTGFVLGPVNKTSLKNDAILEKLYTRFDIETCNKLDGYYIDKEMYVATCTISNKEYYFFLDKNGIIYDRRIVDNNKELFDYPILIEKYKLKNPEFMVIYYLDQNAYWIKSDEYEYVIGYENFEILMKVRQ